MTLEEAREKWPLGSVWRMDWQHGPMRVLDWDEGPEGGEPHVVWTWVGYGGQRMHPVSTWQRWAKERVE